MVAHIVYNNTPTDHMSVAVETGCFNSTSGATEGRAGQGEGG